MQTYLNRHRNIGLLLETRHQNPPRRYQLLPLLAVLRHLGRQDFPTAPSYQVDHQMYSTIETDLLPLLAALVAPCLAVTDHPQETFLEIPERLIPNPGTTARIQGTNTRETVGILVTVAIHATLEHQSRYVKIGLTCLLDQRGSPNMADNQSDAPMMSFPRVSPYAQRIVIAPLGQIHLLSGTSVGRLLSGRDRLERPKKVESPKKLRRPETPEIFNPLLHLEEVVFMREITEDHVNLSVPRLPCLSASHHKDLPLTRISHAWLLMTDLKS